jgi:hypothetical protein
MLQTSVETQMSNVCDSESSIRSARHTVLGPNFLDILDKVNPQCRRSFFEHADVFLVFRSGVCLSHARLEEEINVLSSFIFCGHGGLANKR